MLHAFVEAEERALANERRYPWALSITDLSTDVLVLVLLNQEFDDEYFLRSCDIARMALVNRAFCDAARPAEQAHRRVCIDASFADASPDGRIITCAQAKSACGSSMAPSRAPSSCTNAK